MNGTEINANVSTFCGAILVMIFNINGADIMKTMILAVIGALVSFTASKLLRQCANKK